MNINAWLVAITASTIFLSGCNVDEKDDPVSGDDSSQNDDFKSIQVDANSEWAYVDFSADSEVSAGDDWDLAFQSTSIRSNAARTELALAAPQMDFFDAGAPNVNVWTNATAGSELEHLLANYSVDDLEFSQDSIDAVVGRDGVEFYEFVPPMSFSANSDAWWLIRSAEGDSYAKVNFTTVNYDSTPGVHAVTVEADFFVKGSDDTEFSSTAVTWTRDEDGENCFDFDSAAVVDCGSDTWDVQYASIGRSMMILVNGGYSGSQQGGVFIADDSDPSNELYAMEKADIEAIDVSTLEEGDFVADAESTENMFYNPRGEFGSDYNDWYAYALLGGHGIYPNFRVYAVKETDTDDVTLVQVVNYYNDADESGHVTVRYRALD